MGGRLRRYSPHRRLLLVHRRRQRRVIAGPAIFAWPVLAAQLILFGSAAFVLLFSPVAIGESRRYTILWRGLATLDLAISPLVFLQIASGMAQASWLEVMPLVPRILRETLAG